MAIEHIDLPFADYMRLDGLNTSSLKEFADCPETYSRRLLGHIPRRPTTDAMRFGIDVEHYLRFSEPPDDLVVIPDEVLSSSGSRAGKSWRVFYEENAGRRLLKRHEYDERIAALRAVYQQVDAHQDAHHIVSRGNWSVAYQWTCPHGSTLRLKGLADIVGDGWIADVKTTADPTPNGFARQAANLRYHWQAYAYREAYSLVHGDMPEFYFLVIGNEPPHRVEVYEMDERWMVAAEREVVAARNAYAPYRDLPPGAVWRSRSWGMRRLLDCPPWLWRTNDE
jgi:hypothetical protein